MHWLTSGLSSPFVLHIDPPKVGSVDAITAPPCGGMLHLPQGPSLRFRLCCPDPSSLNRPHPPRSQAPRDFTARRLIREASAVRERLGHPRADPGFRCPFLPGMPSSRTPGSSTSLSSSAGTSTLAFTKSPTARHSQCSRNPLRAGIKFRGLHGSHILLRPARLLGALCGSDRLPSQRRLLLPGFQRVDRPSRCWV
jgi:hypothetical protein